MEVDCLIMFNQYKKLDCFWCIILLDQKPSNCCRGSIILTQSQMVTLVFFHLAMVLMDDVKCLSGQALDAATPIWCRWMLSNGLQKCKMLISHRMNGSSAGYHRKSYVMNGSFVYNASLQTFGFPGAALELLWFAFALADAEML